MLLGGGKFRLCDFMRKEHHSVSIRIYAVLMLAIIVGFIGCQIYCTKSSQQLHTYTFTADNMAIPQDQLTINVSSSKQWDDDTLHPEMPCGAQYDGVLTNQSKFTFKNWNAVLRFSEALYIDSSWNGDFSSKDNEVIFVAQGDPANVAGGGQATFGAVMYSNQLLELESCTITGYRIVTLQDLAWFHVLSVLTFFWIVALFMHFAIEARTKKYRKQQELDSEIIMQSMSTFTGFIDAKDSYTKGHSVRVAEYATEIARRMKLDPQQVRQLYYISLMHDCGKIGVPDAVLQKPGKLTNEEYKLIQSHTVIGDAILVNFTAIPDIRDGAHFHHERYDGRGYPIGLIGEDIPLCARIICVADSFDAMSSTRCYRNRLDDDEIMRELTENAGKQFDPRIVPIMVDMIQDGFTKKIRPVSSDEIDA